MNNVNPIFVQAKPAKKVFNRATRSDKTQDIKFPVTEGMWLELRRGAIKKGLEGKQTKYNTMLLNAILQDKPEEAGPIVYEDTGRYMHVKPTQLPHAKIQELMLLWGLSKRKTVYRLIVQAIRRVST